LEEPGVQAVFDAVSALLKQVAGAESFAGSTAQRIGRFPAPRGDVAAVADVTAAIAIGQLRR